MAKSHSQDGMLYRVRWRGHISGPFALDQLVQMVRCGKLSRHHEISTDGQHWRTVENSGMIGQPTSLRRPGEAASSEAEGCRSTTGTVTALRPGTGRIDPAGDILDEPSSAAANNAINPPQLSAESPLTLSAKRGLAMVVIGLAPLAISFFQRLLSLSFTQVAWLFSAYFCIMWGWIVGLLANWRSELWKKGLLCSIFTCFIGIAMLFIWQNIPLLAAIYSGTESENPVMRLIGFVLGVGLMEELCKSAPLFLFCLGPGLIRSRGDGLLLGMLSGLGFAVNEGVSYTLGYWSEAVGVSAESFHQCVEEASNLFGIVDQGVFSDRLGEILPKVYAHYGELVVAQLIRFMSLPLLHAAWAALVGYSIALSLIRRNWVTMWAGLGTAAILHGVYNFFSGSVYGVGVAGASLAIPMVLYAQTRTHAREGQYG